MTIFQFWSVVFDACAKYGGSITSAHRTTAHNAAVGGASQSQHLGFKAADIVWDDPQARASAEAHFKNLGLWVEPTRDAPDHTHVDDRNDGQQLPGA